jgi:hypothetical protein
LAHKNRLSITCFLFSLLFVFAGCFNCFAGQDDSMEMIVTGQARWSILGSGDYCPGRDDGSKDHKMPDQKHGPSPDPYPGLAQDTFFDQDKQFMEKVQESAMPNRAEKPVYRLPDG